jgi:hypothetical protein
MSDEQHPSDGHDHAEPKGTLLITLVFLLGTAAVFAWTYYLLISRG